MDRPRTDQARRRMFKLDPSGLYATRSAVGLVGAFGLTQLLGGFLFGVTATDPATFATVSLLLGVIAILASSSC